MAGYFLGRWLRLGRALISQGFSGHSTAYIDCPVIVVHVASDSIATTQSPSDTVVSSQAGCRQ